MSLLGYVYYRNWTRRNKKYRGFHDEVLKGKRKGQHSIRLNRSYKAFYELKKNKTIYVYVLEVNKHEY